jgi:hypothetical protein
VLQRLTRRQDADRRRQFGLEHAQAGRERGISPGRQERLQRRDLVKAQRPGGGRAPGERPRDRGSRRIPGGKEGAQLGRRGGDPLARAGEGLGLHGE